jgi:acyl carrier protein
MTHQEIYDGVADALVQALGVSRSDITAGTSLVSDLEAESIDFLEIVFRLEKTFKIEVGHGELFPQEVLRDEALVKAGRVTEEGVTAIRKRFSFADVGELEPGRRVDDVMGDLVTVGFIVGFVEQKLAATAAAVTS